MSLPAAEEMSPKVFGTKDKLVFTFPGQGSFNRSLLNDLFRSKKELRKLFYLVDEAAGDMLGVPFLPMVLEASSLKSHDDLTKCPDLDQLGIYLADYATAQLWLQRGIHPDLLLGHSFGELAAFAVAGLYSFEEGARIVCQRVLSLHQAAGFGRMAAVTASVEQVQTALEQFPASCVAVVNNAGQSVVSGPSEDLEKLRKRLTEQGISVTFLQSRFPFHSALLSAASKTFLVALRGYRFAKPRYPVYSGTEQKLIEEQTDLADAMARQLVTRLDFDQCIRHFATAGYSRFLECGAGTIVTKIIKSVLKTDPAHWIRATFDKPTDLAGQLREIELELQGDEAISPAVAAESPAIEPEPTPFEPIAIVSMGCVFPGGANSPEKFWQNLSAGVTGVVDLTELDPHAREDFVAGRVEGSAQEIVSDKTYTLLNGSISAVEFDPELLHDIYSETSFGRLTKGQRILAFAMAQARLGGKVPPNASRTQCILGSTADGSAELDEAHFAASVREVLAGLEAPGADKNAFAKSLSKSLPGWELRPQDLTPHKLCAAVARTVLGVADESTYLVDSACSSSLYSLALGARALRTREADLVYAGGVFAPGPANNNLFAQFRGLTPNGSRPFDSRADGVVFGDGAGVLALKRLSDAIDDGDAIAGIIRSEGFSSDGKSPSINVPQSNGQARAIRAAYESAALDTRSVQFVEAHATATPVGDAVEFKALRETLTPPEHGPRLLGSLKALVGHTGWTSGVASVINVCKALEHRTIPKQFNYESPNPGIQLEGSGFAIPTSETAWPQNTGGLPRRAGLNGFGFGGTNAHFVIEEYLEGYHKALAARFRKKPWAPVEIVVVAAEGLFPDAAGAFERAKLKMPKRRMVLPDVAEHMDTSQYLAGMAAGTIVESLPAGVTTGDLRIGVFLGLESKTERGIRANERVFLDRLGRVARSAGASAEILEDVRKTILARVIPSGPYTLPGLMPNLASSRISHTFDFHGPNLVIDRGTGSLLQAVDAGLKFVSAGDCEIALAGGLNAWTGHDRGAQEAMTLVALCTSQTAAKNNLPVLARIQVSAAAGQSEHVMITEEGKSLRGATGAVELLAAVRQSVDKPNGTSLIWNGKPAITLLPQAGATKTISRTKPERVVDTPPKPAHGSHEYVHSTPITNYTPILVETPISEKKATKTDRSFLFLVDQIELWREFQSEPSLRNLSHRVATPLAANIWGALKIDTATEASLLRGLEQLRQAFEFDTIVAVKQLTHFTDEDLVLTDFASTRGLLDLLFGVCKSQYDNIAAKRCSLATVCLDALDGGQPRAYTGLFGGFVKSVARELPESQCKAIASSETHLSAVLDVIEEELALADKLPEVSYVNNRRFGNALTEAPLLHLDGAPWVSKDSVIIATGGGRGVTAVLAEHLLEAYGCKVIALGRTDSTELPSNLRDLDEVAFKAYESQFYREQLAADRTRKIQDLKKLYQRYQASNELLSVIRRCKELPGTFEYIQCDITDERSIDGLIENVLRRYGRLDMVLHGAGVQVSKVIPRKTLSDFQQVVSTKLASLGHLYQSCKKRDLVNSVHFHLLTSAFSYLGNDGQADYGAANEAMNRLAAGMSRVHSGANWSTMAWLGWAGIGMTRGTEYAALAASRRLRGVTREEGQKIFSDAVSGPVASSVNVMLAEGEIAFYRPQIVKDTPASPLPPERVVEWPISPETMPFLFDHIVRGIPTVPGSLIIAMAADAARGLFPDLKIVQFERTRFLRLVRAHEGASGKVRAIARLVERNADEHLVRVQIVMDFVHKNGSVLGKDLLHTEIHVRMSPTVPTPVERGRQSKSIDGVSLPDPYVMEGSPVRLNGAFRTMKEIVVGQNARCATYNLNGHRPYGSVFDYLIPNIIMVDAFWRFGTVRSNESGTLSVYVPEKCEAMKVFFDYGDFDSAMLRKPITFHGANPRPDGESLHVGPIDAYDAGGRLLLRVEGGLCRKFGEIEVS